MRQAQSRAAATEWKVRKCWWKRVAKARPRWVKADGAEPARAGSRGSAAVRACESSSQSWLGAVRGVGGVKFGDGVE